MSKNSNRVVEKRKSHYARTFTSSKSTAGFYSTTRAQQCYWTKVFSSNGYAIYFRRSKIQGRQNPMSFKTVAALFLSICVQLKQQQKCCKYVLFFKDFYFNFRVDKIHHTILFSSAARAVTIYIGTFYHFTWEIKMPHPNWNIWEGESNILM